MSNQVMNLKEIEYTYILPFPFLCVDFCGNSEDQDKAEL